MILSLTTWLLIVIGILTVLVLGAIAVAVLLDKSLARARVRNQVQRKRIASTTARLTLTLASNEKLRGRLRQEMNQHQDDLRQRDYLLRTVLDDEVKREQQLQEEYHQMADEYLQHYAAEHSDHVAEIEARVARGTASDAHDGMGSDPAASFDLAVAPQEDAPPPRHLLEVQYPRDDVDAGAFLVHDEPVTEEDLVAEDVENALPTGVAMRAPDESGVEDPRQF